MKVSVSFIKSKLKEEYLKFYENEDNYISLDSELFNEIKMNLNLHGLQNSHYLNIQKKKEDIQHVTIHLQLQWMKILIL